MKYWYIVLAVLLIPLSIMIGSIMFYLGVLIAGEFGGVIALCVFAFFFFHLVTFYELLMNKFEGK